MLPRARPRHLRVQLEDLLVRPAIYLSCPTTQPDCPASVETTQSGEIATAPGEWALYVDVGGIWTHVQPLVMHVHDGQVVRQRRRFDLYVPRGRAWRFFAFARECDFGLPNSRATTARCIRARGAASSATRPETTGPDTSRSRVRLGRPQRTRVWKTRLARRSTSSAATA